MTEKLKLDIPLILPDVANADDQCVRRLIAELGTRAGVADVHVDHPPGGAAKLCIHFDPAQISLSRVRELVVARGARITERYGHLLWEVTGIAHERRARTVEDHVRGLPGVLEAGVTSAGAVRVEYDRERITEDAVLRDLERRGVHRVVEKVALTSPASLDELRPQARGERPLPAATQHDHDQDRDHTHQEHREGEHVHEQRTLFGLDAEMAFAVLCGVLLAVGYAIAKLLPNAASWIPVGAYVAAYFFGGYFTLKEAIENLRARRFEIDTLMLVAAAGAAALGAWAEGALLLFLFSLGHALEHYAMGRAKREIEALGKLAPKTALVVRDGTTEEVPVETLQLGDSVMIRPNERVPADGVVTQGNSAVDQAPITGESMPADKVPVALDLTDTAQMARVPAESRVFAGTINGAGTLRIRVTRQAADSTLARVVRMVSEAETQKSPTQRFTDRFERVFVPAVLILAFLMLFSWVVVDEPFRESFYRAMAVLVAASPCALAIATPSAVLSAIARAARGGVLVKGGAPLENLGGLKAIAFDKTGTLTLGNPRITDVLATSDRGEDALLSTAVAVEALSDHPLARAIVRDARERMQGREILEATGLKSLTGRGVTASIDGQAVWIGKLEMFGRDDIPALGEAAIGAVNRLRDGGRTVMVVRMGDADLGVIGLMDTPRPAASKTIDRLRALGVTRMIMISGDHQKAAQAMAKEVGIQEAWGDLMPEDKVGAIRTLREAGDVAMVGDGVNDAPAMATATVGIAMGAAGSDVALETADVALMADDLARLPFAVGLSRKTRSIIRQNVFVSLGVVAILVPATILGLGIGPAVAVHEGSTLLVVFNALRLLAYSED